jgi:hypothetical protein
MLVRITSDPHLREERLSEARAFFIKSFAE